MSVLCFGVLVSDPGWVVWRVDALMSDMTHVSVVFWSIGE